jgi:pre-mRNA-splicing factor SYF1
VREDGSRPQTRVHRSNKLWCFLADLLESTGAMAAARAAYDQVRGCSDREGARGPALTGGQMIDLKVATARAVLHYALMLEEQKYYEDAFRVRGVVLFSAHGLAWLTGAAGVREGRGAVCLPGRDGDLGGLSDQVRAPLCTPRPVAAPGRCLTHGTQGGRKLERARDLFEQALEKAPPAQAKTLFLLYARLEEEHGLARRALAIYARAVKTCDPDARPELYAVYLARAAEFAGAAATRPIHEEAIASLADKCARLCCSRLGSAD